MIGTKWQNNYTKQVAKILSEPIIGVFELLYEEREGLPEYYQNSHRWAVHELNRHWRRIND